MHTAAFLPLLQQCMKHLVATADAFAAKLKDEPEHFSTMVTKRLVAAAACHVDCPNDPAHSLLSHSVRTFGQSGHLLLTNPSALH